MATANATAPAQHTPSPWYLTNIGDDLFVATTPDPRDDELLADLQWQGASPEETDETYANGYLMAAAPELLEACERLLFAMQADFEEPDAVEFAAAIITKAKGNAA